ncbi:MAG: tetratricopeptide repeat protein [Methylococcales bacterium]
MSVALSQCMAYGAHLCIENKWNDAIDVFQRCLVVNPRYIDALYNLGVCYANLGDFNEALGKYHEVLKLNSMDVEANYNSGVAHEKLGDLSSAIDAYKKTLEIDDRYLVAWVNIADCYYNRGLRTLRQPYQEASGRPIPVPDDKLHTFFAIESWSEEGLHYLTLATRQCDEATRDFKLAAACRDEAMERADNQPLRFSLERRGKSLKIFLGV